MYPSLKLGNFEIDLYTVCLCVGIFTAVLLFRLYADKREMNWRLQRFCIITSAGTVLFGYGSAVFFQAIYNIEEIGHFEITRNTGATFYGGLIGGAAFFLAVYFGAGHFLFKDGIHKKSFFMISDIACASVSLAHSIGRLGCLFAGCCHGRETEAWYGIQMGAHKYLPVQLYEAVFLLALFGLFTYRVMAKKSYNLPLYMMLYGIWRFIIEYFRADERGSTFISFLSPSQLTAIFMAAGAVALFFVQHAIMKKTAYSQEGEAFEEVKTDGGEE